MKLASNYKTILITAFSFLFISNMTMAQVPPAGKYNTTNYPEERKALEALFASNDSTRYLNDDHIAVGPEGRVSYGIEQWRQGFRENKAVFKSVTPRPGTYILRIYNGNAAVRNMVVDVVFDTPGGDMFITVVRTETYIKQNGKWYFVAGQGTKLMSKEELEGLMKQSLNKG